MQSSIELEQIKYDIKRLCSRSRAFCPRLKNAMGSELFGKWQMFDALLMNMERELFEGERHD